jgi:hypothetical protein
LFTISKQSKICAMSDSFETKMSHNFNDNI